MIFIVSTEMNMIFVDLIQPLTVMGKNILLLSFLVSQILLKFLHGNCLIWGQSAHQWQDCFKTR